MPDAHTPEGSTIPVKHGILDEIICNCEDNTNVMIEGGGRFGDDNLCGGGGGVMVM